MPKGAHLTSHYRKRLVLEASPAKWVGTKLVFRLAPEGEARTRLDVEHARLVPAFECYGPRSGGWEHYVGGLRRFVDTGRGTPYEREAAGAT